MDETVASPRAVATLVAGSSLFLLLAAVVACGGEDPAQRAARLAERQRAELLAAEQRPLEQEVSPETVREVQRELARLGEYQGEAHGELDAVTVNAIQAFQRSTGVSDDGIIDPELRKRLRQEAKSGEG